MARGANVKELRRLASPGRSAATPLPMDAIGPSERGRCAARTLTVDGNRLRVLPDGPERLEALLELIDGARQSLRLLYYIYLADASGERVKDGAAPRDRARS